MTEVVTQATIDALAQNFHHFAEVECKGSSQHYHLGQPIETLLAYCDGHARWIEWLD